MSGIEKHDSKHGNIGIYTQFTYYRCILITRTFRNLVSEEILFKSEAPWKKKGINNKFTLKVGLLYCSSLPFGLKSILFRNLKHDNCI